MHINDIPTTFTLMQEGDAQIATLREDASEGQIAEHIRGMVAATMGNLSIEVPDATRNHAQQWQKWALSVADRLSVTD